ncbi:hypothetical protein SASPL_125980 [Salvia splendens]|uniref:Uncharacterized protein n=1 Tax=Salvia splendens TaxID=180675 RepID=A0A8X8XI36_SALSN|nr:hypothetical protein SASPL_125980 [Salvia splendens]
MEKELLDRVMRFESHINTLKSERRRLCISLGDVTELDQTSVAYMKPSFSKVMVNLSGIIRDFEGLTQDFISLKESQHSFNSSC